MKFFIDTEEHATLSNTYEVIANNAEEAEQKLLDFLNNTATVEGVTNIWSADEPDGYGVTITDNRKEL